MANYQELQCSNQKGEYDANDRLVRHRIVLREKVLFVDVSVVSERLHPGRRFGGYNSQSLSSPISGKDVVCRSSRRFEYSQLCSCGYSCFIVLVRHLCLSEGMEVGQSIQPKS